MWQSLHDADVQEDPFARQMEGLAQTLGAGSNRGLLHSVVGKDNEGQIVIAAATGALDDVSRFLASIMKLRYAIVLDNGGSVGWMWCTHGARESTLLLAGPNWRPRGTAFIQIRPHGFLQPEIHPVLRELSR
jgi:hypothetical protein